MVHSWEAMLQDKPLAVPGVATYTYSLKILLGGWVFGSKIILFNSETSYQKPKSSTAMFFQLETFCKFHFQPTLLVYERVLLPKTKT